MSQLTIYQDSYINATILSNRFIDEYMTEANDAQLKIYLYLVRMMSANLQTSVADIADRFNYTEKDVLRAFKYWQKKKLLDLDMDESGVLVGVHLVNLCRSESVGPSVESTHKPQALITPQTIVSSTSRQTVFDDDELPLDTSEKNNKAAAGKESDEGNDENDTGVIPIKPSYSASQIKAFKKTHGSAESGIDVFYLAEEYRKKPLTPSDINTIMYICEELGFSDELFDYLLQYCAERDKSDFRYIEKVAISWREQGITTPEEASGVSGRYEKKVYDIMRQLGKTGNTPTDKEVSYIIRWTKDFGFADEIILEACDRTVMATEKNRFQYADKILEAWSKRGVKSIGDVKDIDAEHKNAGTKKVAGSNQTAGENSSIKFNRFTQREDIDFDELEKKVVKNQ